MCACICILVPFFFSINFILCLIIHIFELLVGVFLLFLFLLLLTHIFLLKNYHFTLNSSFDIFKWWDSGTTRRFAWSSKLEISFPPPSTKADKLSLYSFSCSGVYFPFILSWKAQFFFKIPIYSEVPNYNSFLHWP